MILRRAIVVFLLLVAGGCSVAPQLTEDDKAQLAARAEARWRALEARDWATAYRFMSPAYRNVFSEAMYVSKFSYMVDWELTSIEVVNYDARAAVASVAVRVMSRPAKLTSAASAAIGAVPTRQVERWILNDGEWWYSANL